MHISFAADNRSRLCTKTISLTIKIFKTMKKKEILSRAELQEMTGLDFHEQNSQAEESRMLEVDATFEKFLGEESISESIPQMAEQLQTEAETPVAEEQPPSPTIQRRVSSKQRKLSLEEYRNTFM